MISKRNSKCSSFLHPEELMALARLGEKIQPNQQCTNKYKQFLGRTQLGKFVNGVKRGFEGMENVQTITAVREMNWKHFFPLWKRTSDLCWKAQKLKQRTFCFHAVSKELSQVLTTFCGKGFGKSCEERWEDKGEQRCWGPAKPLLGAAARNCRGWHQEEWGQ